MILKDSAMYKVFFFLIIEIDIISFNLDLTA